MVFSTHAETKANVGEGKDRQNCSPQKAEEVAAQGKADDGRSDAQG